MGTSKIIDVNKFIDSIRVCHRITCCNASVIVDCDLHAWCDDCFNKKDYFKIEEIGIAPFEVVTIAEMGPQGMQIEFLSAPEEGDVLDCRSAARFVWSINGEVLTRSFDREQVVQRDWISIPLFPLARWLVTNWWSIFFEPLPFAEMLGPGTAVSGRAKAWVQRHCVRSSSPGFALPFVCIFSDGNDVRVVSRPDPSNLYPATPVEFLSNAEFSVGREAMRSDFSMFIDRILVHLDGLDDVRVTGLRTDWDLVRSVSSEEMEFCRASGWLGLDPYDVQSWPPKALQQVDAHIHTVKEIDKIFSQINLAESHLDDDVLFQECVISIIKNLQFEEIDLANRMAVSKSTIARWCSGHAVPHPAMRKPVFKVLKRMANEAKDRLDKS